MRSERKRVAKKIGLSFKATRLSTEGRARERASILSLKTKNGFWSLAATPTEVTGALALFHSWRESERQQQLTADFLGVNVIIILISNPDGVANGTGVSDTKGTST